jgi:carbonic anhydrase
MDDLIEGYRRFRQETWPTERRRYQALAERGQKPRTLVIGCSDSRVDPQTVFGAGPGELFVVRNVAGLVPPFAPDAGYHGTSAAVEYAVRVLQVDRIVVLGHALCGGVRAMVEGVPPEARDFVEPWLELARPAKASAPDLALAAGGPDALAPYEIGVVRLSVANLMTFPWIADAVGEGRLALAGFRFDIRTGVLENIGPETASPVV